MHETKYNQNPGFYPEPIIICLPNGNYKLIRTVFFISKHLPEPLELEGGFEFSPSIPRVFARIVYITSRVVKASLPHDFIYQVLLKLIPRKTADKVGLEVLELEGAAGETKFAFYWGLRLGGWKAWNDNKRKLNENNQVV